MHQFYCWFLLDWFCWSFIWPRATFRSFFKTPSLSQWQQPPMSFFPHFSLRSFISSSAVYSAGRRSVRWPPLNPLTEQESFFQNHEKLSYMVVMGIGSYLLHHLTGSVLITSKTKHCTAFFYLFIYFPSEVGFVCWHRFWLGSVQSWSFVFFFFPDFPRSACASSQMVDMMIWTVTGGPTDHGIYHFTKNRGHLLPHWTSDKHQGLMGSIPTYPCSINVCSGLQYTAPREQWCLEALLQQRQSSQNNHNCFTAKRRTNPTALSPFPSLPRLLPTWLYRHITRGLGD